MRFPEFSGEWTKRKIKNIFENVTRGYVLSKKDISTIKTNIFKYPVYSSQTLNSGLLGYYLNYLYENAITWTTDGANAGEVNFRRDKFYCTNVCGVLLSNNGYCNDCMAAIINKITKKFVSFVGNPKLMNNVMENIEIIFPSNIKEQLKVASFLSLIDKRIELQNKIIRDYKLLKKLMNDRLIYKNENKVMLPLNEFATLKNGYAFKGNINFKDGKYSVITITNVTGDRLCNIKNINKVNHLPLDIQKHQILKSTDILISLTGNVGRVSYCGINNGLLNQRVGLLEIFDKQKVEYIFQALSNKEFEKRMISLAQGGSQLNLSKNDIEKYKIPLVSDVEANKISNLLMRYDLKILLGKNSLSNYKKVKKFLLMQLFI